MATKTPKYESTKALDELFIYSYKLRKSGVDASVVEQLTKAYMVGAPAVAFEITTPELTEDQKKLIDILKSNDFDIVINTDAIIVKNAHLDKLRKEVDEYLSKKA